MSTRLADIQTLVWTLRVRQAPGKTSGNDAVHFFAQVFVFVDVHVFLLWIRYGLERPMLREIKPTNVQALLHIRVYQNSKCKLYGGSMQLALAILKRKLLKNLRDIHKKQTRINDAFSYESLIIKFH